ncbi:MAG: hypothetical protein KGZ53_08770 [Peptococcaceae bacterium]|nr:hypothetical protein [Peptococcaceae bacterium]
MNSINLVPEFNDKQLAVINEMDTNILLLVSSAAEQNTAESQENRRLVRH